MSQYRFVSCSHAAIVIVTDCKLQGVLPTPTSAAMAPKRKITDYAPPPGSKRAKKTEEVPSGDDGFGEHAAVVDGSQQPTKGDLNKLYSAMQYEKTKHEKTASPLRPTRPLVQPRISTASGATTSRTKSLPGSLCRRPILIPSQPSRSTLRGGWAGTRLQLRRSCLLTVPCFKSCWISSQAGLTGQPHGLPKGKRSTTTKLKAKSL